jgi:hypothetical protein
MLITLLCTEQGHLIEENKAIKLTMLEYYWFKFAQFGACARLDSGGSYVRNTSVLQLIKLFLQFVSTL